MLLYCIPVPGRKREGVSTLPGTQWFPSQAPHQELGPSCGRCNLDHGTSRVLGETFGQLPGYAFKRITPMQQFIYIVLFGLIDVGIASRYFQSHDASSPSGHGRSTFGRVSPSSLGCVHPLPELHFAESCRNVDRHLTQAWASSSQVVLHLTSCYVFRRIGRQPRCSTTDVQVRSTYMQHVCC